MHVWDLLTQPLWQQVAECLLHFLWQGTLIAGALACALRAATHATAQVRYLYCLSGLLLMLAAPIATWFWLDGIAHETRSATGIVTADAAVAPSTQQTGTGSLGNSVDRTATPPSGRAASATAQVALPAGEASLLSRSWLRVIQPGALLAWLGGITILSARLVMAWIGIRLLRWQAVPVSAEWITRVDRLSRKLAMQRYVQVLASDRIRDALVAGFYRPFILIPTAWLTEVSTEDLEAILAHELAHIRRHDLWVNLLQRVTETLLFYHPLIWWLSNRLRDEREKCCDELAVQAIGDRLAYAQALARVAETSLAHQLAWGLGLRGSRMNLLDRVKYILGTQPRSEQGRWWPAAVLLMTLPLLLIWQAWDQPALAVPPPFAVTPPLAVVPALAAALDRPANVAAEFPTELDKALATPIRFEFVETPLADVIKFLADQSKAQLVLDQQALAKAGISTQAPISLNGDGIPLGNALRLLLEPLELGIVRKGELLVITTAAVARSTMSRKVYDVSQQIGPNGRHGDSLLNVIQQTILPRSWDRVGGPGSMILLGNTLIVNQTDTAQRGLASLLQEIVDVGATGMRKPDRLDQALAKPVTAQFIETPLSDAVAFLASAAGVKIQLDHRALEDAGIPTDIAVTLRAKQVALAQALAMLMVGVPGLDWLDRDGVLMLTSQQAAARHAEVRVYPLGKLLASGKTHDDVKRAVFQIDMRSWSDAGGSGAMAVLDEQIIVVQSPAIHRQIVELLKRLGQP